MGTGDIQALRSPLGSHKHSLAPFAQGCPYQLQTGLPKLVCRPSPLHPRHRERCPAQHPALPHSAGPGGPWGQVPRHFGQSSAMAPAPGSAPPRNGCPRTPSIPLPEAAAARPRATGSAQREGVICPGHIPHIPPPPCPLRPAPSIPPPAPAGPKAAEPTGRAPKRWGKGVRDLLGAAEPCGAGAPGAQDWRCCYR